LIDNIEQLRALFGAGLEEPGESALPDLILPMELRQQLEDRLKAQAGLEDEV